MPAMIVWLVSSSVRTWKVGSSSESFASASPILSWSAFVFGSMATCTTGSGELHGHQRDRLVRITERVARGGGFAADHGADIARAQFLEVCALVGVHFEQAAKALLAAGARIEHHVARVQHAAVHADEGKLADVRVGENLECERGEGLVVVRLADDFDASRCPGACPCSP
jgi:hypothetical protein